MNNLQDIFDAAKASNYKVPKQLTDGVTLQYVHDLTVLTTNTSFVGSKQFRTGLAKIAMHFCAVNDISVKSDMYYWRIKEYTRNYSDCLRYTVQYLIDSNFADRVRLRNSFDHLLQICCKCGVNVAQTIKDYL